MKKFKVYLTESFYQVLSKIDRHHALLILSWLHKHLEKSPYPRKPGKALMTTYPDM